MVRAAERARFDERMIRAQKTHDGIDLRDVQLLLPRHIGQDGWQALGKHALTGTRRAYQKNIMPACRRNFKGALCIFLPFYILEVQKLLCSLLRLPDGCGIDRSLAGQVRGQLPDVLYAVDGQTASQRGLACVILRDVQLLIAKPLCGQCHRQHARDSAQHALQTEFSEERARLFRKLHLFRSSQDGQENRQVIKRAGFFRPRRSKIHDNTADRKPETAVFDRGAHPLARLFNGRIRQADQIERRKSRADVAFRLHLISVDA